MNRLLRIVTLGLGLLTTVAGLHAEDMGTLQRRLQERQSAIDSLKQKELVGEDNRGFLSPRGSLSGEQSTVVSGENADRGVVYTELAKRNSSTAENVGKLRAKQIAERSASGIWLQDETGKWYKK